MTSLLPLHIVAVSITILLISFLVIFNMEQLKEYENLRDEINCKLAECETPTTDPVQYTQVVNNIVGNCIQQLMKEVQDIETIRTSKLTCSDESSCEAICTECDPSICTTICSKLKPCKRVKPIKSYSYTQVNYADAYLGARVVSAIGRPFESSGGYVSSIWGQSYGQNPPEKMLYPDMEPGCCFAFKDTACVTIALARPACIEAIEIAHIQKSKSPTRETSSAPKDFKVYGITQNEGKEICLGQFVYDNCETIQLYAINTEHIFELVKFEFLSNHGNLDYTCVYKVGVYGKDKRKEPM